MGSMQGLLDQSIQFIERHQEWAGLVVFLMALGESLFLIGILLPATVLLFVVGGLVGNGSLPWAEVLCWGFLGAVIGDALSYWLGCWAGPRVLRWRYLKSHRKHVARARLFFYRYGFLAVLIGRFLGPVRSLIPTVAGAMGMPQARFQLANILSAAAWMPALLAPGYLAAISMDAAKHAQHSTIYSAVALCIIAVVIWVVIKQKRAIQARRKIPHRPMR